MKKLTSILLAAVLLFSMLLPAAAAVGKIKYVNESSFQTILDANMKAGKVTLSGTSVADTDKLASLTVYPGGELRIYLTPDMFLDADKKPVGANNELLTSSILKSGKITLRALQAEDTTNIITATLSYDKTGAFIKVAFIKPFCSIDKKKFNLVLYLNVNGSRKTATKMIVAGTLTNKTKSINSTDDYVDISDGTVVTAKEAVKKVEFYLGEYCSITRSLVRSKRIYGIASTDIAAKDEAILRTYPYIEYVYTLKTIGMKDVGNIVSFDLDDKYYVYNYAGTYLGTSDKKLPYSTKYYISYKKYTAIQVA